MTNSLVHLFSYLKASASPIFPVVQRSICLQYWQPLQPSQHLESGVIRFKDRTGEVEKHFSLRHEFVFVTRMDVLSYRSRWASPEYHIPKHGGASVFPDNACFVYVCAMKSSPKHASQGTVLSCQALNIVTVLVL